MSETLSGAHHIYSPTRTRTLSFVTGVLKSRCRVQTSTGVTELSKPFGGSSHRATGEREGV